MTQSRMNFRPRGRPRGRPGRNVWVNENVNASLTLNTVLPINLLTSASDFMTFDTTIRSVIIPDLTFTGTTTAVFGKRQIRCALIVAPTNMDADDFEPLFADSIGPPWLGVFGRTVAFGTVATVFSMDLALTGLRFKAKRRFRENDSTLFMITQNLGNPADTGFALDGMVRTLIHIP